MEQTTKTPRTMATSSKRTPLAERQPRARQKSNVSRASATSKVPTPSRIPHHESVYPEGNLSVINRPAAPSPRPTNERVIAIAEDDLETNKRDSQISTTSTVSTGKGKRKTHIGPWQLGRTLGKGATGRVRLAKHSFTGQTAAIKIVSKKSAAMVQSASMRQMDNDTTISSNISGTRTMPFGIEREIVIMKLIEHPNVISLYDIWENRGELYLVLEYVEGGELFDYVMRNSALPEGEAVRLLRQLIAGLAYCHRFNICHRDLKPENILLDRDHNIKIADFGMAALQPSGQYLTTSCGSPHYAAPEIIAGRQYRGDRADIWSIGIILYAMLNGYLPFDGGDLHSTLALVKKGEYYLSPDLSVEAADLIQSILQKRPEKRISMKDIWRHPLLRKYERIHASLAAPGKLAGPPSPLTAAECGPRRIKASEIDRELLRNLQILWHGLGEADVIDRLTSEEPNHEKLFYWALIRFREEQLENYQGDLLQYSASDYHHLKPAALRIPKSTTRSALHTRRTSQFSIVSEDSIVRAAYYKNPGIAASKTTQGSYDPYRASRTLGPRSQKGTSVVVRYPGSRTSIQGGSDARNMLRGISASTIPNLPSMTEQDLRNLIRPKRATYSTVSSYSSLASSHRRRTFRTSTSYRRNVSFQHLRQRSGRTSQTSKRYDSRDSLPRPLTQDSNQGFSDSRSTPSLPTPPQVARPRRPASDLDLPGLRPSNVPWRDDTRHISAELSKICEEAFNRSSISHTSDVSRQMPVDSPATTVSIPESLLPKFGRGKAIVVTPALRDLLEHRSRIIQTWGESDSKTLADIVGTLDRRILEEQQYANTDPGLRAASDPTNNKFRYNRDSSVSDTMQNLKQNRGEKRAASDPVRNHHRTIRLVTPDPTSPIAMTSVPASKAAPINSLKGGPNEPDRREYDRRLLAGQFLEPIFEDPTKSVNKQPVSEPKKWSWLVKKATGPSEELPPTPPRKDTPKQKNASTVLEVSSKASPTKPDPNKFDGHDIRKPTWFQKVFAKRKKDGAIYIDGDHKVLLDSVEEEEEDSMQDLSTQTRRVLARSRNRSFSSKEGVAVMSSGHRLEPNQNWFAKFLHLKPATRILVMRASKVQSRKEIVKILREWRRFGVRDVAVEKSPSGDVVRARVDSTNYLRIRPVQFFANVYTVLERGKLANLSIIKFTQQKGAASSFYKVVDTMESVFKEADLILPNFEKRKKILKSAKRAGL